MWADASTPTCPGSTTARTRVRTGPVRSVSWCGWKCSGPPGTPRDDAARRRWRTGGRAPSPPGGAQRGQQRDRRDLLVGQVVPDNAGRRARARIVRGTAVDDAVGRDNEVDGHVVTGQRDLAGRPQLELVHGGDRDGVRADQAGRGGQGELQVGESAALAEPGAVRASRDT